MRGVVEALHCCAVLVLADLPRCGRVPQQMPMVVELLPHLSHKRLQGGLFPPLGRDVAPVGAGVQREVKGGIRQFEPATQTVRLVPILLRGYPRNAEVAAQPHERPESLKNAPGVLFVPRVPREISYFDKPCLVAERHGKVFLCNTRLFSAAFDNQT